VRPKCCTGCIVKRSGKAPSITRLQGIDLFVFWRVCSVFGPMLISVKGDNEERSSALCADKLASGDDALHRNWPAVYSPHFPPERGRVSREFLGRYASNHSAPV